MVVSYYCEGKNLNGEGCLKKEALREYFGQNKVVRAVKTKETKGRMTNHHRKKGRPKPRRIVCRACKVFTYHN